MKNAFVRILTELLITHIECCIFCYAILVFRALTDVTKSNTVVRH